MNPCEEASSVVDVRIYLLELTFLSAAQKILEFEPLINHGLMLWYAGQDRIKLHKLSLISKAYALVTFCKWINATKAHFSDTKAI